MNGRRKYFKLNIKITAVLLALLILTAFGVGIAVYNISRGNTLDEYKFREVQCIILAQTRFRSENIEYWLNNGCDDQYKEAEQELSLIRLLFGLKNLYVFCPVLNDDGTMKNEMIYVFDVMLDGEDPDQFGELGEHITNVDVFEILKELYNTKENTDRDIITYSDEYGFLLSNYGPLLDDEDNVCGFIGADIDMEMVLADMEETTLTFVTIYTILIIIFVAIFSFFLQRSIVKPVKTLSDGMNHFVSNGMDLNFEPITTVRTRDEIEQMSDDFNSMAYSIIEYTHNLERSTAEKERMKSDLDVSAQIRASISAQITYPAFPERSDFSLCASLKNTVFNKCSFCNYFLTDESHLYIVVGESAGKSLASMLVAMLASTNIQCFAKMGYPPYRIAIETNNQLCNMENRSKELLLSAVIAEIDLRLGTMRYVNAGMPPLLIKKIGENFEFQSDAVQFGFGEMRGISFTQETLNLQQGFTVMFSSFGVSEMENAQGAKYTIERVKSDINDMSDSLYDLQDMTEELENRLDRFRGDAPVELDTTICTFRYFG